MATVLPPPPKKIKRKPVPSAETVETVLSLNIVERYPPPDPNDPFAPLSVLRSRSSTVSGRVQTNSFTPRHVSAPITPPLSPEEPLRLPVKVITHKESHYRRRSQSIPFPSPPTPSSNTAFRASSAPLSLPDSGSDTDSSNFSSCPNATTTRNVVARIFLAKKSSTASISSDAGWGDKRSLRKVSAASSLPMSSPRNDRTLSTRGSTDSRPVPSRMRNVEQGYYSHPETSTRKKRSTLVSSVIVPTESFSSSYVDISTPSQSVCDDRSSTQEACPTSLIPPLPQTSTEWLPPTSMQLAQVASVPLIAASGLRVPFGSVFAKSPAIVIFIRHFWCPLCQDYIASLASLAPRQARIVIISNGSNALIDKYKQMFGISFEMYVDPGMEIYRALGMRNAGYSKKGATFGGLAMVVLRALRVGMPVWEKGGDVGQLGGEFILGPGLKCSWAHRMQTPKGHVPVASLLEEAGIKTQESLESRRKSMRLYPDASYGCMVGK